MRGEDAGAGTTGELAHHLLASVHPNSCVPDLDTAVRGSTDQKATVLAPHQVRHLALLVAPQLLDDAALGEIPDPYLPVFPSTGRELPIRRGSHGPDARLASREESDTVSVSVAPHPDCAVAAATEDIVAVWMPGNTVHTVVMPAEIISLSTLSIAVSSTHLYILSG